MKSTVNWLPSLVSAIVVLVTSFSPQIQSFLASHAAVATAVAGFYAILTHVLPSPVKKDD